MTQDPRPFVRVVAGIVLNHDGDYLLSSRPEGKPYAGYWEFAGGKLEEGETEFHALQREFEEELGIQIHHATPWLTKIYAYEHAHVHLRFWRVESDEWSGELQAREGQMWSWQKAGDFTVSPMLPANTALLKSLSVPRTLTGRLSTGLAGVNRMGVYQVVPYHLAAPHDSNLLVHVSEWQTLVRPSEAKSVWVWIQAAAQWPQVQNADVVVWQIADRTAAEEALVRLHQGVSVPLVIAAVPELAERYQQAWHQAGAHAVFVEDEIKAV